METVSRSANRLTLRSTFAWIRSAFPMSEARRIAVGIRPEAWESVRRKLDKRAAASDEFRDYVQIRCAQLVQVRVDELVRSRPSLSGAAANKLILKATRLATEMVLAKVKETST